VLNKNLLKKQETERLLSRMLQCGRWIGKTAAQRQQVLDHYYQN
jgi:hypothetical protein